MYKVGKQIRDWKEFTWIVFGNSFSVLLKYVSCNKETNQECILLGIPNDPI